MLWFGVFGLVAREGVDVGEQRPNACQERALCPQEGRRHPLETLGRAVAGVRVSLSEIKGALR